MIKTSLLLPQGSRKAILIAVAILYGACALGCAQATNELAAAGVDYAVVDRVAEQIYGQVVEQLYQPVFVKKVNAGLAVGPTSYASVVLSDVSDGDYAIGGRIYHNVLASAQHAPRIKQNLASFAKAHPHMSQLFNKYEVGKDTHITQADLKLYVRFGADFLAMRGFSGGVDDVMNKYSFVDLVKVMRTGIFVTQLPVIDGLKGGNSFGLSDSDNNNGAGASAAGATYAAVTAEVTGRTSMGTRDPVQCRQPDNSPMVYTNDEEINGKPIAGVDGQTLGTTKDGETTSMCGKCATIGGTQFIIVDRIWQNDGVGGNMYSDKNEADKKGQSTGSGQTQFDIAVNKWKSGPAGGNNMTAAPVKIGTCN